MDKRKRTNRQTIQWTKERGQIDRQYNRQKKEDKQTDNTIDKRKRTNRQTIQWTKERGQIDRQYNGQKKEDKQTDNRRYYEG